MGVTEFIQRFESGIHERRLLTQGQKVLAAVSGGVDSMVLLQALHELAKKHSWQVYVGHFNHRLRGRASDADARLVCQTAGRMKLELIDGDADVKKIAGESKLSIEMAARKLRHAFLARAAREHGIPTVVMAHHADDQVELFFLRLFRGSGGDGLAGMKSLSVSPADKTIFLARPLLDFSKAELLAHAKEQRISFRNDATNFACDMLRNRVRNELLPLLRKRYQAGLDKAVLRSMDIIGAESEWVAAAANEFCSDEVCEDRIGKNRTQFAKDDFKVLPLAIQRKVLQRKLTALGLAPDFELIEHLRKLPGKAVSVGGGLSVTRDDTGRLICAEQVNPEFNAAELVADLSTEQGSVVFGQCKVGWKIKAAKEFRIPRRKTGVAKAIKQEVFDADSVGPFMVLRHWRAGDRFQPIGLKSPVKLQDLFVNAKIPVELRRRLVVAVAADGEIFWVEGLRIGERFKLTGHTTKELHWRFG